MALCLTVNQKRVLSYYQSYFAENGTFPSPTDAGRHFGVKSDNILKTIGAVFLKGGFTDGKPLTNNLLNAHGVAKPSKLSLSKVKAQPKAPPKQLDIEALIRQEIVKSFRNMMSATAPTLNE